MPKPLKKGDKVNFMVGLETRVNGYVVSGPHAYTDAELAENVKVNEYYGYSTKRMPKHYYECSLRKRDKRGKFMMGKLRRGWV